MNTRNATIGSIPALLTTHFSQPGTLRPGVEKGASLKLDKIVYDGNTVTITFPKNPRGYGMEFVRVITDANGRLQKAETGIPGVFLSSRAMNEDLINAKPLEAGEAVTLTTGYLQTVGKLPKEQLQFTP